VQDDLDFTGDIGPVLWYTVSLHGFRGHVKQAKQCPLRSRLSSSVRGPIQYFWAEMSRFWGTTEKHRATLPASV